MALAGESLGGLAEGAIDAAEIAGEEPDAEIAIALGRGNAQAHVFFSDLGHEYIRVNAEYRT